MATQLDSLCFSDEPPIAAEVARGVTRLFCRQDLFGICKMPLPNGRRADIMAIDAKGGLTIVEIKVSKADLVGDGKWQDYLDYCDRLYFAVRSDFPCDVIPNEAGLILADRYGAEIVREPLEERLSAARRKAMMLTFARAAALRLQLHLDPACGLEL